MRDAFAYCEARVHAGDRDRFLAALFAPPEQRAGLFALYAFNLEIARIREAVHNPLAGEVRLQWWSDLLAGQPHGGAEASPVAAALLATAAQHALELEPLRALIDARRFDLYDEPMSTLADLEAYADAAAGNMIALAAQIVAGRACPDTHELVRYAGRAQAIAGLLAAFPVHSRRGQLYMPLEVLQRHGCGREDVIHMRATPALRAALAEMRSIVRKHLRQAGACTGRAPAVMTPALLPVAVAGRMLARMDQPNYDPFMPMVIASWRRQWCIWRAARNPRRIFL